MQSLSKPDRAGNAGPRGRGRHTMTDAEALAWARVIDAGVPWVQIVREALAAGWRRISPGYYNEPRNRAAAGLPYRLHETDNPEVRCVVNRGYKHVGTTNCDAWSDYDAPGWHVPTVHFERLRDRGIVDENGYFFSDKNPPWCDRECLAQYRAKVEALLEPWAHL